MNDLNIAVIGYGARGKLARHAHQPGAGSAISIVCDPTERARTAAEADFGPEVTTVATVTELIDHPVDAVMVLTPDHNHAEIVEQTLRAGIPTFCEKPMAITVADADRMLNTAKECRTRLYIGHNMRHMPVVRQLKQIIDSGRIGRVRAIWCRHFVGSGGDFYFKDWHAERDRVTSLLLQKGAHDIDVIHWLAGGYTRQVQGIGELMVYGSITDRRDNSDRRMTDWYDESNWPPTAQTELNPVIDVEDISMLQMRLDNGVLASYQQCHFTPDYWRNYTIIGDAGRVENMGDSGGDFLYIWDSRHGGAGRPDAVEVVERGDGGHGGADPRLVAEFLQFVRRGGQTEVSAVAARESVATGCRGSESIRGGGALLEVPELPAEVRDYFDQGQPGSVDQVQPDESSRGRR